MLFWTNHALERLATRGDGASTARCKSEVLDKVLGRDWEEWWEVDPREGRGLRLNLLVKVGSTGLWAVVRERDGRDYIVASVLTDTQYRFNCERVWSRTDRAAKEKARSDDGKPRELRHNPFAKLLKEPS